MAWFRKKLFSTEKRSTIWEILYLSFWFILFIVLWKNMLMFDGQYYWTGWQNIWGDWSMHFPYITNFAYRSFPLPWHPLYWGYPFNYHYAADLLTGLLMRTGLSLVSAVFFQGIVFSILLVWMVYVFYAKLYHSKFVASLALLLFFFNGGTGLLLNIYKKFIDHTTNIFPVYELTHIDQWNIRWVNFITGEFISQRPFLIGMPIALGIVLFLWRYYQDDLHARDIFQLMSLGIGTGLLPVIHIYSFFVVIGFALYVAAVGILRRRFSILWTWYFFVVGVTAWVVFHSLIGVTPVSYVRFDPGWMAPDGLVAFVIFWLQNIGIMALLIPVSLLFLPKKIRIFAVPFGALFILSNLFIFQPNEWDNRKFLLYWYFFSCGTVAYMLVKLYGKHKNLVVFISIILFYTSVISGFVDVLNLLNFNRNKYRLFSLQDIQFAKEIRDKTDEDSVFLTYPANNWLGMVLGRQIIMGFENWINNIGADTDSRKQDIISIYAGESKEDELIKKYSINYVIVGPVEKQNKVNESDCCKRWPILIKNGEYTIYEIRAVSNKESKFQTSE